MLSTSAKAADWLKGTDVMQSYANCAGTVGNGTVCVATEALTCAHGLDALWRGYNGCESGEDRAMEASEKHAIVLRNRAMVAIQMNCDGRII